MFSLIGPINDENLNLDPTFQQTLNIVFCFVLLLIERKFCWFSLIGLINDEFLKECLMTMGERWNEDMVEDLFHGAPIHNGLFDYKEFTRTLKHGSRDKEDDQVPSIPPEELAFKPNTST